MADKKYYLYIIIRCWIHPCDAFIFNSGEKYRFISQGMIVMYQTSDFRTADLLN